MTAYLKAHEFDSSARVGCYDATKKVYERYREHAEETWEKVKVDGIDEIGDMWTAVFFYRGLQPRLQSVVDQAGRASTGQNGWDAEGEDIRLDYNRMLSCLNYYFSQDQRGGGNGGGDGGGGGGDHRQSKPLRRDRSRVRDHDGGSGRGEHRDGGREEGRNGGRGGGRGGGRQ